MKNISEIQNVLRKTSDRIAAVSGGHGWASTATVMEVTLAEALASLAHYDNAHVERILSRMEQIYTHVSK
jgi:hypothetical protein